MDRIDGKRGVERPTFCLFCLTKGRKMVVVS